MTKISFIGMGEHGVRSHLVHLIKMEDVEIVGAFDPNPQSFAATREATGLNIASFASAEQAVMQADAVMVMGPDHTHLEGIERSLHRHKHVFCEKPLCTRVSGVERLEKLLGLAEERGLIISSCHPRRFDPPYIFIKENLESWKRRFGALVRIDMDFSYHKPSEKSQGLHGGSLLQDHANHEIDFVAHLLGRGHYQAHRLIDGNQNYQLAGSFNNQVAFHFSGTRHLEARKYPESVHLRFERGEAHVETYGQAANGHEAHGKNYLLDHETGLFTPLEAPSTDYELRFRRINENFVGAVRKTATSYISGRELLMNSAFSVAFHDAASFDYHA